MRVLVASVCLASVVGCGTDSSAPDSGRADSGTPIDSAVVDAAVRDAGDAAIDAAVIDGGGDAGSSGGLRMVGSFGMGVPITGTRYRLVAHGFGRAGAMCAGTLCATGRFVR